MSELVHLVEPPSSADAPVLLALHGTGGSERDLLPVGRALLPGAALIAPRGPVVEGDGIPRFFRRIPTGGPGAYPFTFDDAEIAERAAELGAFLDEAVAVHGLEGRPRYAVGFSNGANIATALLLLVPGAVRGVVAFAPMPVLDAPPAADLSASAAWLGTGRADPIATPALVERLAGTLDERGAAVEVAIGEGGHEVRLEAVRAAAAWLAKLHAATGGADLP